MQLVIQETINREIIHHVDGDRRISSRYRTVFIENGTSTETVMLPESPIRKIPGLFRLTRRALRLDKCNVFPVGDDLVIIRQGNVFFYDWETKDLNQTLRLRNCPWR